MESSKIMMFPEVGGNSIDPNLLMALNNNGGFGGNNWIWILFLWLIWGWGGNGNWGGNGSNGFLFKSEDVESLKEIMGKALGMTQMDYKKLKNSTIDYVEENYSLQSITKRYIEYFNRLT